MLLRAKPNRILVKRVLTRILPSYSRTLACIGRTEWMDEGSLSHLQFQKLKRTLIHAYKNVPYYRTRFQKEGLNPDSFSKLSDIQDYPFLDKQMLRDNIDSLVRNRITRKLWPPVYTGGTTGTPLRLYRSASDYGRERAFLEYSQRMMGIDPFAKLVYMRGPVYDSKGKYYHRSVFCRTLYLSSNAMDDTHLELYVNLIREYQPVVLYALPSVAVVLADYMERERVAPIESIRHVWLLSENIYSFQARQIERVFRCPIGTQYGHSEHAVFGARCPESSLWHVLPQYGYAELVDQEGKPVCTEGERGEIVGTAFTNSICPLIRYRTGDYAVYTNEKCPCGRNYPMWKNIQGRQQSVAITKSGGRVSVGPELLCTLHDRSYGEVKQFQIRQTRKGELEVSVESHRPEGFDKARRYFMHVFEEQFPNMFDVRVVARESAGELKSSEKHLYFVQCMRDCCPESMNRERPIDG